MNRDLAFPVALAALSAVAGLIGWSGFALALPASLAFPILWSMSPNRRSAAAVSAAYFLAASRGLPQGVAAFYQSDLLPGLALWVFASFGFVFVHTMLWTRRAGWTRPLRYLLAMLLMALPPFGIVGWAHPITAAGILLPGLGWSGLTVVAAGVAILTTRYRPPAAMAFAGLWLSSAACWTPGIRDQDWQGVDLRYGGSLGRDVSLTRYAALSETVVASRRQGAPLVVLPESALGFWTPTTERWWRNQLKGSDITLLAGAAVVNDAGYDNVLVQVSQAGGEIVYRERMPVPGSMWQPWARFIGVKGGAQAHFFDNPVIEVDGRGAAPLICYEQLLVWPILQSMTFDPDVIAAVGNGWWTAGTSIIAIQQASVIAWARLFGVPVVMSFNS
jgi:hypothetical protein